MSNKEKPRNKADDKIPELDNMIRNLVENSPNMVFIIQNGKVVYANQKCEELMGYTQSHIYSPEFDFLNFIAPEHRATAKVKYDGQLKGEIAAPFECTLLTGSKQHIESIISFTLVNYRGGQAVAGIVTDITDLKGSEKALSEAKAELEISVKENSAELMKINEELQLRAAILDKATDAIFLRVNNYTIIYANEAASKIYGYSKDEFIGMYFRSLISPREASHWKERQRELMEKGEIIVEGYHLRKDKSEIPVENHSHLIKIGGREYILSVVRDITRRRQTHESLRQSEMQFQKLFDAMSEGVALIDTDGKIIKANRAEARIMGFSSPEELEGRNIANSIIQRIFPDGAPIPPDWSVAGMVIKHKRHVQDIVIGFVKDGSIRWHSINAAPLFDTAGNISGVVRTFTDITEQKRLQDEKEQFTRRLIAVQERKRVARELHDDTAQNLALLMLEIDMLLNTKEQLPAKFLDNLKKLKEDIDRTQREVRRYSHELRPGVLEHLGLEAALENLAEDANSRRGTNFDFNIEGEGERLTEEKELALFRIAQEAVNNVLKHAEATQAEISLKYTSNIVRLTIADNGKGFKPKKTSTATTGGLGLVGMQERAELIKANLKIRSTPGKGTVVRVEVPIGLDSSKE